MNFDAFELIEKGLQEELAKQGFSQAQPLEDEAGKLVMFSAADVAYGLLYDVKHQRFELRSTTLKEDGQPGAWRSCPCGCLTRRRAPRPTPRASSTTF